MTAADFIAQYGFVILGVLAVAYRDAWPMLFDGNVEREIRREQRAIDSFEAKIVLAKMQPRRVT